MYQGRASYNGDNSYVPDGNGNYDIYLFLEVEPYGVGFTQFGEGDLNWSEIGSSSVGLLLGIGEVALGASGEFFTGGLSTAIVIDGVIRVGSNATKLGLLFSDNNRNGVATPTNAGGWVGKMFDLASGSTYGEISTGQGIGSFTNDFITFSGTGGSALSLSKAIMYPSLSSVYGYGLTITGTPYTAHSDLINWFNSKK
jgi:hypothetical protein